MEEKSSKSQKRLLKRITVYVSPELKSEMEGYKKKNNYSSLSGMLKTSYRILKEVMGSRSVSSNDLSLAEKLEQIENQLEEIQLRQQITLTQEALIEKEIEEFPIDEIPNYEEVAATLLDFIQEFDGIKDFVLMDHFRSKYSEGIIWTTLNKLQKQRKLKIKKGEWFINS